MNPEELYQKVFDAVKEILLNAPGCHDFDHTLRVMSNAEDVAKGELALDDKRNWLIVRLAALLHDCARPEELESCGKINHAALGREKSANILRRCGCTDEELIQAVADCVGRHRYRGKEKPETLADKIVYDADKLDSIGAVGIGRAFHFAGRSGARLHNTAEEALACEEYSRNDSAYREYLVKLRNVPGRMLTETGRALAVPREKFMHGFFERLNQEANLNGGPLKW